MITKELLEEIIYKTPLALLSIKDADTIARIREYLPYSTGFEIECHYKQLPSWDIRRDEKNSSSLFKVENFKEIPKIMAVDCSEYEQRYRIPYGINGLICLYLICEQLKENSALNPGSGIHYHVDMTGFYSKETLLNLIKNNEDWILTELDSWNFKGKNQRGVFDRKGGWLGFRREKDSAEFRCGDMSFDYNHLVTRIISANSIIKRLKDQINLEENIKYLNGTPDLVPNTEEIVAYIKTHCGSNTHRRKEFLKIEAERVRLELQKLKTPIENKEEDIKQIVNLRTKKMV